MVGVGSPSEAVLDYYELAGTKQLGPWATLAPAHPQRFDAPAADRHREGPPHARGRRPPLSALRRHAAPSHDRGRGGNMAVEHRRRRAARRGLRGREAGPPPRPDHREDRHGRVRGPVALRDLLGAQPGPRAALPHELPRGRARDDVPRLPRLGQAQGGRGDRVSRDHGLGARDRLGGGARLHARDVRRVRAPRRAAQRPRHRLRRGHDPARAGGDAPHGRVDPARGGDRLPALRLLRRRAAGDMADLPRRLRRAADRRPDLHGAAGHLRRAARRRRHLHRLVHPLRRGARVLRAPGSSSSTSRSPRRAARAPARAARPRWPASCSARCLARASPRR